jgi:hypothetical protein
MARTRRATAMLSLTPGPSLGIIASFGMNPQIR